MRNIRIILVLAIMMVASVVLGDNEESLSIDISVTHETNPKRDCSPADIILFLEYDCVIIQFNGDFGYGHAEIRNLTNNDYVSSDIYAQNGGTEELYISISNSSSYEFLIHFNDGRYSSIIW